MIVSDYQVETNLYGHDSHGCIAIPRFVKDVRTGKIVPKAAPEIIRQDGPTALMNGNRCFGQFGATRGTQLAIARGRRFGMAVVGITNCNHVGALWGYIKMMVDAGLVGLMMCGVGPRGGFIVPFGGTKLVLGGNPVAFGVPGGSRRR